MLVEANKNTLFYSFADYQKGIETINRIKEYILTDFTLVGGFANRYAFPDYFVGLPITRLNDLDFCIWPKGNEPTLGLDIVEKFYIMFINPSNNSYYFMLIDKENFIKVDIFVDPRPTEKKSMKVDDLVVSIKTEEEVLLKTARDVYGHLSQDQPIEEKHVQFYNFLRNNIDLTKIDPIWLAEKEIIYKINLVEFDNWFDYLTFVDDLIQKKRDLIIIKKQRTPEYPVESAVYHPFGFSMVDRDTFDRVVAERNLRFFS
jgi:hypothetical protein